MRCGNGRRGETLREHPRENFSVDGLVSGSGGWKSNGKPARGDWLLSCRALRHQRWHFFCALHAEGRACELASGCHSRSSVDGSQGAAARRAAGEFFRPIRPALSLRNLLVSSPCASFSYLEVDIQ